nr:SDR family NAD(P)-dependent oxidoreductase [Flavobacteriales bacterium]
MATTRKVILVTGGSSGLGKSICVRLAGQGHTVYGTSRKAQPEEITDGFRMVQMDVTDDASVQKAVAGV